MFNVTAPFLLFYFKIVLIKCVSTLKLQYHTSFCTILLFDIVLVMLIHFRILWGYFTQFCVLGRLFFSLRGRGVRSTISRSTRFREGVRRPNITWGYYGRQKLGGGQKAGVRLGFCWPSNPLPLSVRLNSLIWNSAFWPPQFLSASMSKKRVGLIIVDLKHPTPFYFDVAVLLTSSAVLTHRL